MINTSTEYKEKIRSNRIFYAEVEITLTDGTVLLIHHNETDSDIMQGGFKFEDGTSGQGSFDIGAAVIGQFTLKLSNADERYSQYEFDGAVLKPRIGLKLSKTVEWMNKGIYTVDETSVLDNTIVITALDHMEKFDKSYSESTLTYPATLREIVDEACSKCGVALGSAKQLWTNYTVEKKPEGSLTYREILSAAAQISGVFCRCNTDGRLELRWYNFSVIEGMNGLNGGYFDVLEPNQYRSGDSADGGGFAPWDARGVYDAGEADKMGEYHHLYNLTSQDIGIDDVVITGIRVSADSENSYLSGSEGYVLDIEKNPLIESGREKKVAEHLSARLQGVRFRPMNISAVSDPSIEAGDIAYVSDRSGNSYATVLTNLSFSLGETERYTCDAKTPSRNSAVRYSEETKAVVEARKEAKKELSGYDTKVEEMTSLISQGFGMYFTSVEQPDGSKKSYIHDKPSIEESSYTATMTSNGLMASLDGGTTWAIDKVGNALFNVIVARGINADWIDVGEMLADRIRGGTLILGGSEGQDGSIQILSSEGREIGYIDKTGAYFLEGDFAGRLSAISGLIGGWIIDQTCIYSDFTVSPTEIYRVYLQTYLSGYGKDTWIFSVQRYNPETDKFYGTLYIRGDGKISTSGIIGNLPVEGRVWASGSTPSIFEGGISCGDSTSYPGMALSVMGSGTVKNDLSVYGTFYAASGSIASSDRRLKNDVKKLDQEQSARFIYSLRPVRYKYNDGTSGRYHHGFIAQDVKKSMGNDDWGVYCKVKKEKACPDGQEPKEQETICSLRYEELIADMVAVIQSQNERITKLENMLKGEKKNGNTK